MCSFSSLMSMTVSPLVSHISFSSVLYFSVCKSFASLVKFIPKFIPSPPCLPPLPSFHLSSRIGGCAVCQVLRKAAERRHRFCPWRAHILLEETGCGFWMVPVPGGSSPAQGLTSLWPTLNRSLIWGQMPGSGVPVHLLLKTEFRMLRPSSTRVLPRAAWH